ncbi:MAG: transglutaminase-like domain-containing protein [Candidatus Falkowbacteria bacterium]
MKKIYISILIVLNCLFLFPFSSASAATSLSGRIFLQVQDKGQAWYVYPVDSKRYYLGRPTDAFNIMKKLGLGVSEKDFYSFAIRPPKNILGRIILRVQSSGQAYYVDPLSGHLNYLDRPDDAYRVIRSLGQGITNTDLNRISLGYLGVISEDLPATGVQLTPDQRMVRFLWKYNGKSYYLDEIFSKSLYNQYSAMPRVLSYRQGEEPANMRDSFYAMFMAPRSGDNLLDKVIADLKVIAQKDGISGDKLAEFMMAFVQYIPYDTSKFNNTNVPNYLYETLYRNSGVCSDKSFLSVAILRKMNYGAAVLDYPDNKHSAAGVSCPVGQSTSGSGYCFVETTNFFPIGVVPNALKAGQAESTSQFDNIFSASHLGTMEIYQKSSANSYSGLTQTMAKADLIKKLVQAIDDAKNELNAASLELANDREALNALQLRMNNYKNIGDWDNYNSLIPQYNEAAKNYNDKVANYQLKVDIYNANIREYNSLSKSFYQQN